MNSAVIVRLRESQAVIKGGGGVCGTWFGGFKNHTDANHLRYVRTSLKLKKHMNIAQPICLKQIKDAKKIICILILFKIFTMYSLPAKLFLK